MNERIKELADQVGLGVRHDGIVLTKHVNAAEAFEQFAQLIVKECANWMCDERDDAGDRIGDSFYWSGKMLKHFGVDNK